VIIEVEVERLSTAYISSDAAREREVVQLSRLENELRRTGPELSCNDYMELQARIAQQRQRVEAAEAKAAERRAALDAVRSEAADREQKEIAERRYDMKRTEFERAESALNSHRQQLAALSRALPELEQKFNIALRELADAKHAAAN